MRKIAIAAACLLAAGAVAAQNLKYYPAQQLTLIGKGFDTTETAFERLPISLKATARPDVWRLGKNTSGLAVRFRTNSKAIGARWELLGNTVMNHMSFTGVKGLDLYCLVNGRWQFVNTGRPTDKRTTAKIIENLSGEAREYLLYLPLYDGVVSLEIGVDSLSTIGKPEASSLTTGRPVVFYGTSITQGACASRPGMAYPNILSRRLDRPIVNLGFSANGKLDLDVAQAMARIDAACFVVDCVPNVTVEDIRDRAAKFIGILRAKHPKTPILMIENPNFPHIFFDTKLTNYIPQKNEEFGKVYKALRKGGDHNIHYISTKNLIGHDYEGTVDGIHLTDLGFMRMVEEVYPTLKKLVKD